MRNHRRKRRETIAIPANVREPISNLAIGSSGIGQPKLTYASVQARNSRREDIRVMRMMENSLLELRSPIATCSVSDFDCSGRGAGYLTSRSVKNSRMSKGQKSEIRLSSTRNPNARARPTGGVFKEAADSQRRAERNW